MDILAALNSVKNVTPSPAASPTPIPTPTITLLPLPTPVGKGAVFGIVNDTDGYPLQGVKVTIDNAVIIQDTNLPYSTETDENGYYLFIDLAVGNYALTYEREDFLTQTQYITLAEGEVKDLGTIILEGTEKGSITGHVVNTKDNPIKSVKIKLKGITTKTLFTTFSDATGFFEFTGLEADTYTIIANKKGYKRSRKTVVLKEGAGKEVQIKMKKAKKTVLSVTP
jgi:hypothetical protein